MNTTTSTLIAGYKSIALFLGAHINLRTHVVSLLIFSEVSSIKSYLERKKEYEYFMKGLTNKRRKRILC